MAKNEILPFGLNSNANVLSPAEWSALSARSSGFNTGVARSKEMNTALRQSSVITNVVAQFIADKSGKDVLDNGDTVTLQANLLAALKTHTDSIININTLYPIGIVLWFAQNKNPNTLFPGTTWTYIGENKTIRLGKADGSDVNSSGGADSVVLTTNNLPAHNHSFSANTSSFDYGSKGSSATLLSTTTSAFDYGTKTSTTAGTHSHSGVPSRNTPWQVGGNTHQLFNFSFTDLTDYAGDHTHNVAIGAHSHNVDLGSHTHSVAIGAHTHTVSGTTTNTGTDIAVNITNAFIKLMGWYRSA